MVNFLKYRWLYFAISAIVIGSGIVSMVRFGYIYSIDFVGGTNIEYQLNKNVSADAVRTVLKNNGVDAVTVSVAKNVITARAKAIDEKNS
jgi:preprotein translocase subunit SecF